MEILTARPHEMTMEEYRAILKLQQQSIDRKKLGKFVHVASELVFDSAGKISGVRKAKTPFTGQVFKHEL